MNDLSKACLEEAKNNMQGAVKHLESELTKIRAGKANPAIPSITLTPPIVTKLAICVLFILIPPYKFNLTLLL